MLVIINRLILVLLVEMVIMNSETPCLLRVTPWLS